MAVGVDEESRRLRLGHAARHRHRFRRRRRLVEQRGVGEFHAGEVHHHLLKVEQGFEAALAHLGLVRRVRGVPRRVLEHVAQHHRRGDGAVIAHSDHGDERTVPAGHRAQGLHRLALGQRRVEGERLVVSNRDRDGPAEKVGEGRNADDFEHRLDVLRGGTDVARCEIIPHLERIERAGFGHGYRILSLALRDGSLAPKRIESLSYGAPDSDRCEPCRFNRHPCMPSPGACACNGPRCRGRSRRRGVPVQSSDST